MTFAADLKQPNKEHEMTTYTITADITVTGQQIELGSANDKSEAIELFHSFSFASLNARENLDAMGCGGKAVEVVLRKDGSAIQCEPVDATEEEAQRQIIKSANDAEQMKMQIRRMSASQRRAYSHEDD